MDPIMGLREPLEAGCRFSYDAYRLAREPSFSTPNCLDISVRNCLDISVRNCLDIVIHEAFS